MVRQADRCAHGLYIPLSPVGALDIPIECKGCAEDRAAQELLELRAGITVEEFMASMRDIELKLDNRDCQAVVLALAHLAIERPGWDAYLRGIAERLDPGLAMFDEFKRTSLQPRPHHEPRDPPRGNTCRLCGLDRGEWGTSACVP